MISRLFKPKPKAVASTAPLSPRVPDGCVVWAIGDVHGRLDLLEALIDGVLADAASQGRKETEVVFLGDYIDRGPESRGVLQYLIGLRDRGGLHWRFLKGNHEEAMLRFLADPAFGQDWCTYGGGATLRSYGLKEPQIRHRAEAWKAISQDLDHKLTAAEKSFLEGLELSVSSGDYFFAHAGARPGEPLDRQTERDLMWIRNSFLDSDHVFAKVVVHGHTPTPTIHCDHRRIGIDTRAYESGVLSALRLEGDRREALQAVLDPETPGRARLDRFALDDAKATHAA